MKSLLSILFISVSISCSLAQVKKALTPKQINLLDAISTQDVPKRAPGIASGVVLNGKVVYKKYAGYANLGDSSFITSQSRFNIASNGKQFTALAVLMLLEKNKLKLSDDIRHFFPRLLPTIKEKISIENLLTHSSGIRDVYDLWALQGITWWKQTFSNEDALALLSKQNALNFPPGTAYSYSNSNYILLALIVEKVSGKTFRDYTNTMFKGLNMPNTSFEPDYKKIRGPVALPYFNFDTWFGYNWICNIHGDGNLFSTLDDQLVWEQIVQIGKSNFLSQKIIAQSQQLIQTSSITQYAYGLEFGTHNGIAYRYHEGSTGAWKATVVRFPAEKISIVTLTNSGKTIPYSQTRQAADVLLEIKDQPRRFATTPKTSGPYVSNDDVAGVFQNEDNFTFTFEKRDTSVFLLRSGRNDTRLVRESTNIFHQWNDSDFKQEFAVNAKGDLQVTAYYTSHAPYTLTRAYADWTNFNHQALIGDFENTETATVFTITLLTGNAYEVTLHNEKRPATLVTPEKLMFDNYSLDVMRDSQGNVAALLLSGGRIKNVKFSKKP